jgi:hypothetical protein
MVNLVVLEYLRVNRGNYPIVDLRKKILSSGYSQKDIDDALIQLNKQSSGNVPSISTTINKINRTNLEVKPIQSTNSVASQMMNKPKKNKKLLLIILTIVLLILIFSAIGGWWFFIR